MPQIFLYLFIGIISLVVEVIRVAQPNGDSVQNLFGTGFIRRRNRRISALKKAQNYLKPYEKIFGNITLSNKFCSVTIQAKDKKICCRSNVFDQYGKKMMLFADTFGEGMDCDEYFNVLCEIFNYNTGYSDVYQSLTSVAVIKTIVYSSKPVEQPFPSSREPISDGKGIETIDIMSDISNTHTGTLDIQDNLIDVNNCSEAELTALPGISIVTAKKIINFRESERPYKSVDDFIAVMKIKPHFAKQLKKLICANKVDMKKVKKAKSERIIDL